MGFIYLFGCLFSENKTWVLNFFFFFWFSCVNYVFLVDGYVGFVAEDSVLIEVLFFWLMGVFWIVELWLVGMDYWLKCFFSYVCLFWLLLFLFLSMFLCYLCGQSDLYCRKSLNLSNMSNFFDFLWTV